MAGSSLPNSGPAPTSEMRHLLLLRHAEAGWDDPHMPDHSRPLNTYGRQAAQILRDTMRALDLRVDLVLVSSARRTMQTLQCLSPFVSPSVVEPMDALYLAPASNMLHVLRQITPTLHDVLVIGHNPGLHDLAALLADPEDPESRRIPEAYPTLGLTQLAIHGDWGALNPGHAKLVRFIAPPHSERDG